MSSPHRFAAFLIALVALPAAAAAQAEAPPPEPPPPPKKLSVGTEGLFNPSLLLQGWFTYDHADDTTTSFRVRRAEIHVRGEILPKQVAYEIFIDPARAVEVSNQTLTDSGGDTVTVRQTTGNLTILQDFYVTYLTDYADVSIGQFKIPVSLEGTTSAAKLYFPERALVAGTFGDKRDIGLRLTKKFDKLMYMAELVNGAGQNLRDNTNEKDASLRLEIYPIEGLTIAGATYDTVGDRDKAGTKDRWEGDLRYESGPFLFQSEFIHNRDVFADGGTPVDGQGFYALLGYKFPEMGSGHWKGVLQPVVRVGMYDPNVDVNLDPTMVAASNFGGNDERFDYEFGVNYYLRNHEMKLQASYDRQQFDNSDAKAPVNEVIVAAQISF